MIHLMSKTFTAARPHPSKPPRKSTRKASNRPVNPPQPFPSSHPCVSKLEKSPQSPLDDTHDTAKVSYSDPSRNHLVLCKSDICLCVVQKCGCFRRIYKGGGVRWLGGSARCILEIVAAERVAFYFAHVLSFGPFLLDSGLFWSIRVRRAY